ncbi:hypothetical protein GF362_05465 [Candidatus Dojkabacteria bacterium]|nr:hypothetical protein [Candidatus Dojkabacteria bacterium]
MDNKSMHDAVCDKCGKDCKVPFKPTSGKPIFCSECFEQKQNNSSGGFNKKRRKVEKFDARCDECGTSCKLPFKPSSDKPVYCNKCFQKHKPQTNRGNRRRGGRNIFKNDFAAINSKLDRIIELLEKQQ